MKLVRYDSYCENVVAIKMICYMLVWQSGVCVEVASVLYLVVRIVFDCNRHASRSKT